MAVSIKAATATVNSTSKKSTKATKENTVNMTQEQLAAIIATAVAQALAATTATAAVAPVATKQTLDQAISGSVSNRFINWTGSIIKTAAEKTAPVVGKVEVLAVPVTLHATGYML